MLKLSNSVLFLWLASLTSIAVAQRNGGERGFPGAAPLPAVGTRLPDVKVFDEEGADFSTTSMRGNYTVLVFGCLT